MAALFPRSTVRRLRGGFTRRLALWAGYMGVARRSALKPLAMAAVMAVTGAHAQVPGRHTLPKALQGITKVKVRGKTLDYTWQMQAKNPSVLGAVQALDNGQVKQVLTQYDRRAIYNWASFDIGEDAIFEFDMKGGAGSAALNRVVNSLAPSKIHGRLNANGEVFLINRNGVLFGARSQVNVQGLVASMLNMDDDVFLGGLTTIDQTVPSFAWDDEDGMATYDAKENYVKVEKGARIVTPSGGRVILLAPTKVVNEGFISTPGGQTALVAGKDVYLRSPSTELIYASELNAKIPALRGLLFEVDGRAVAENLGQILTERGNTTLMAHIVRQGGAIKATTSVLENGSVFLLARSGRNEITGDGEPYIRALDGGELTLASGSSIEITPDNSSKGSASVQMTASRIELSGHTIDIGENARIKAPGAVVNVRATESPDYLGVGHAEDPYANVTTPSSARVVMRQGASIDVSGTQDTEVSVARHFVETEFLRNSDLAGTPFLKEGALLNKVVTYDTRSAPAVLEASSHQGQLNSIQTTAGERMAHAGSVNMMSTGAVLMQPGSTVNVSGGSVNFTDAEVSPTRLHGADGKTYTLSTARKDVQIVAVSGQQAADATRFGNENVVEASSTYLERGYVHGGNGGAFNVQAPVAVIGGDVRANVEIGARQAIGLDPRAKQAYVRMGLSSGGNMLGGVTLFKEALSAQDSLWADPLNVPMPSRSAASAAMLNGSGAGQISVRTEGGLTVEGGANLTLQQGGALSLTARGAEGIELGGSITGAGASVAVVTQASDAIDSGGGIVLKEGQSIDVSGSVVNKRQDGSGVAGATAGGQVSLKSAQGLTLEAGTAIDVSGGATVSATGVVTGTRAGAITLEANNAVNNGRKDFSAVSIDKATLSGYSMAGSTSKALGDVGDAQSGLLRFKVSEVDIVGKRSNATPALTPGTAADGITLDQRFFNQGGFSQFDIEGTRRVNVAADAVVAPVPLQWVANATVTRARSGSKLSGLLKAEVLPQILRPAVSMRLRAPGAFSDTNVNNGELSVAHGALIDAGARGEVVLHGGRSIQIAGHVKAAGGRIETDLVGADQVAEFDGKFTGTYRIDAGAVLDVSGAVMMRSSAASGRREGLVLDGGKIDIKLSPTAGANTSVLIAGKTETHAAAQLKANGTSAFLDHARVDSEERFTIRREVLESDGGSITVAATEAGALLAGDMSAKAGGVSAQGGEFKLSATNLRGTSDRSATIIVQQGAVTGSAATPDQVRVSADALAAGGFDSAILKSNSGIETDGGVALKMKRDLLLDAPVVMARASSVATMAAGSRLAWQGSSSNAHAAAGDDGKLTLAGDVLDIIGQVDTGATGELGLQAASLLRLSGGASGKGRLATAANVHITAPQVTVSTAQQFTLDAAGRTVTIDGGNAAAEVPLSAGASLTVKAGQIDQDGVIRLPFGQVTLSADTITLGDKSLISVSGDGVKVPYGSTTEGGTNWSVNGVSISALPEKAITLDTGKGEVTLKAGSAVDLSAGGQMLGWEFVPGPGGAKDIFQGVYETGSFAVVPTVKGAAPLDAEILRGSGVNDLGAYKGLARQITFGEGGPVPAGTYIVLPARYALMEGAYLVRTSSATPMALGAAIRRNDGSSLVGAVVSATGQGQVAEQPAAFEVMTREAALRFSEIRETTADDFVAAKAARLGLTVPRLARDAGALNLIANKMSLAGSMHFDRLANGRGGELNIAADNIHVGAGGFGDDTLHLDVGQLNATKVDSLLLGGQRRDRQVDGSREVDTAATNVTLGAIPDQGLSLNDVVLVAQKKVELQDGAVIAAASTGAKADTLQVKGDGGLVRVSADDQAVTVHQSTAEQPILREQGQAVIGAGTVLAGGAITIESTSGTSIDDSADIRARQLTLGAPSITVGDQAAAQAVGNSLLIGENLAARLARVERLTLRAFDYVGFAGNATLGGAEQQNLTIDTPQINLFALDSGTTSGRVEAGTINLVNTTGQMGSTQEGGTGRLDIVANGANGADGLVSWRDGTVAVSGDEVTTVQAARGAVFSSRREAVLSEATGEAIGSRAVQSGMAVGGQLNVAAPVLTTASGAMGQLTSAFGDIEINTAALPDGMTAPSAGLGGTLALSARSINQQGVIDLPSGAVSFAAREGDVSFASGSVTKVDGQIWQVDGLKIATPGGSIAALSQQGNVHVNDGALLSASAPAGIAGAQAGEISLLAPRGTLVVDGTVRALSDTNQKGGKLTMDALIAPSIAQLADKLNQSVENALDVSLSDNTLRRNMAGKLYLQQRSGDIEIGRDTAIRSSDIKLVADDGIVAVQGKLDASGERAGSIALMASGDVQADGELLASASANGANGGQITLAATQGEVSIGDNARLDLSAGDGGTGGALTLRASQTGSAAAPDGEVRIAAIGGRIEGASEVEVQAVRTRNANTLNATLLTQLQKDSETFINAATNTKNTLARVLNGKLDASVEARLLAAQVVQSNAALNLTTAWNLGDSLSVNTPMDLTIRTSKSLALRGALSSGFSGQMLTTGRGANINLVAGADLSSADQLATAAEAKEIGNVVIGAPNGSAVVVRSTTGDINIAAAGDVRLLNEGASVYTTGRVASDTSTPDAEGFNSHTGLLRAGGPNAGARQKPFLTGGGSVAVRAGGSIALDQSISSNTPYASQWLVTRQGDARKSEGWWTRYDMFRQGIATFGGGNVSVTAGSDVRNLQIAAAGSGYRGLKDGVWRQFGGGDVAVRAGADIGGLTIHASGSEALIQAGQNINATAERGALQVFFENTAVNISARQDLVIGRFSAVGQIDQSKSGTSILDGAVFGLAERSTLNVTSAGGGVTYLSTLPTGNVLGEYEPISREDSTFTSIDLWPTQVQVAAPTGSIAISHVIQASSLGTDLSLLAHGNLDLAYMDIYATAPWNVDMGMDFGAEFGGGIFGKRVVFDINRPRTEVESRREPVRLVAETGDVTGALAGGVGDALNIANPVRIVAGRDVNIGKIHVQHQSEEEMSVVRAGRDLNMIGKGDVVADIKVHGPGDALFLAGRDVNLTTPAGFQAPGSRENSALPVGGANVTVMAGVDPTGADYNQALQQYFHLLGGAGVAEWAPDLYAQLIAIRDGELVLEPSGSGEQSATPQGLVVSSDPKVNVGGSSPSSPALNETDVPLLGSAKAAEFAALSFEQKLIKARTLVGDTAYQQAVLAHMRGRAAMPTMSLEQALTGVSALPRREHDVLVGKVLAGAWFEAMSTRPEALQIAVLAMSAQRGRPYEQALMDFVQQRTGETVSSLPKAMQLFQDDGKVSAEARMLFTNKVLRNEVREAGTAASLVTGGDEATFDAYQRGFNAIGTVFPDAKVASKIQMGSSNIKSLQNSDLTLLVPHGGVNVGRLTGDGQNAANLGIVTAAGGNINVIARDSIEVNQSRIFTVGKGDMLLWSSLGNIDAGKGAKTVVGAPPPVYGIVNGQVVVDTSGSFSGSGIAALDEESRLDLYAPYGEINAGEAGIRASGRLNIRAARIIGGNDIKLPGGTDLAPPVVVGNASTSIGSLGQSATAAGPDAASETSVRGRSNKRQLMLELLGFGERDTEEDDSKKDEPK